jgi:hypothetical protein
MSTFIEAEHPRHTSGKFAEKQQSAPANGLSFAVPAGTTCTVCGVAAEPGDEWGTNWSSDDDDRNFCEEHNTQNPTSDDFAG